MQQGILRKCTAKESLWTLTRKRSSRAFSELRTPLPVTQYVALLQLFSSWTHEPLFQTVSALETFMLAMIYNPDLQKRGQAAVDAVIGTDRLPDFSDLYSIPFVTALMKESLRWKPVTPLGVSSSFYTMRTLN